jgi:hypothetical protein
LDHANIEKERKKYENKPLLDREEKELDYATHTERRERETERFRGSRPNTLALSSIQSVEGAAYADRWGKMRTKQGLFIAAKELSWDWLTSYNCLDKVGPNDYPTIPPVSAVRDESPSGHKDGEGHGHDPQDDMIREPDYPVEDNLDRADVPEEVEEPLSPTNADVDMNWRKRRANLDYPYPANEFRQAKQQRPEDGGYRLIMTPWAEETNGRLEWHAYHVLSPSSEVYSPPRSPIDPDDVALGSLSSEVRVVDPTAIWQVDNSNMVPLVGNRRRCAITADCRAWWPHRAEECWIVYSTMVQHPTDGSALTPLDTPLCMAEGGATIYHSRLTDHYGMRQVPDQERRWPKLGIRVPYEPMAFDDRKLKPVDLLEREEHDQSHAPTCVNDTGKEDPPRAGEDDDTGRCISKDAELRGAYEFHSMTVPIIKQPQRDWGEVYAEPSPRPGPRIDAEEESEDDGDLFRMSYHEGRRQGSAVPPDGPRDDPTDGAQVQMVGCRQTPLNGSLLA